MTESKHSSFSIIITTVDSSTEAESISKILVENKLAVCVNIIGPSTSVYNWKNNLVKSKEYILWIKTISKNILSVTHTIKTLHSNDVPEIISIPFNSQNDDYSNWIFDTFNKEG